MKVNRRRTLFYQRRTSNLYRAFLLVVVILIGVWFITRLRTGVIHNPFAATPTSTRTVNSFVLEGDSSFEAGNLDAAVTAYQQATRVDPGNALVWADLARIQTYSSSLLSNDSDRLERLTEALQSADQALALAPEDADVLALHAFVLDWNADSALDSLRSGDRKAVDFIFEAEQEAVHALSLDSQNPLALAFYAEILVDQQKWPQAEQYIVKAAELGPQVMDVHRIYGAYLESTEDYTGAIEEYQKALTINPNLTFLYISIAQNYRTLAFRSTIESQQNELYDQALENFAKAAAINEQLKIPGPLPYLGIAKTYAQQGEFFAAALNAQKAVALDPTNADLYGQLGNIYKRGRNFETSIIALRCAVEGCTAEESCLALNAGTDCVGAEVHPLSLNSNSATYYLDLGSVLSAWPDKPGYCTEALEILTQVRNAYPDNTIIVRNADVGIQICTEALGSQGQPTGTRAASAATPTLSPTAMPTATPYP